MRTRTFGMVGLFLAVTGLLGILLACAPTQGKPTTTAPSGANVVKAFSKQHAGCEELEEWTVQVKPGDWIDVGIEWIAATEAIAKDNWQRVSVAITLDGQAITDLKNYQHGPEKAKLVCPKFTWDGAAMAFKVFIPPLPAGDHKVTWELTINSDLNDGWDDYPKGTVVKFASTVRVVP